MSYQLFNPRKPTQVEPDKQIFSIYDCESQVLYISNRQKIGFYRACLKEQIQKDVFVKNFYINVDEFAEKIKTVSSVKLITTNNLFSAATKLFDEEKNVFGLGAPANFTLEAVFSDAGLTQKFVSKLKDILSWKQQGEVDALVCIGKDDRGVESIFNVDSFIEQVSFNLTKDRQGLYDPSEVMDALIGKVRVR